MSVFLQPCGNDGAWKHFNDTVRNPVPVLQIVSSLPAVDAIALQPIFEGRSSVPVWGVKPGKDKANERNWERIKVGDVGLFGRHGFIVASGVVAGKTHSRALAENLWGVADGETWEYEYFLDEVAFLQMPYADFHQLIKYPGNPSNWVMQKFAILDADKSGLAMDGLDLWSSRHQSASPSAAIPNALLTGGGLDKKGTSASRKEQAFLRAVLFQGRQIGLCCMCGDKLPVDLLMTAHVKRRADCTDAERLDVTNIVAAMCLGGCDALYERGYVIVDSAGIVQPARQDVTTPALREMISRLAGRSCLAWRKESEVYFAAHRTRHIGESLGAAILVKSAN